MQKVLVWVRDKLFGNWDRALTTVSFIATLVGSVVTVFLVAYPSAVPQYIVVRDILFWFALIFMSLIVAGKYIRRETLIRAQIDLLSNQFKLSHDLVHNFRTELFSTYFQPNVQRQRFTERERRIFSQLCAYVTEGVKTSFSEYFRSRGIDIGTDIALSVKLVMSPNEVLELLAQELSQEQQQQVQAKDTWIITVYRDSYTHTHSINREIAQRIYDIDKNTAFRMLVRRREVSAFCCNDLQSLGITYDNENEKWRFYYNAALVVPIRYLSLDGRQFRCYGVLAVDSLNEKKIPNLYNEVECKYILGHAADLLATFFVTAQVPFLKRLTVNCGARMSEGRFSPSPAEK